MENKIELKSISKLLGMNFFIPSYQRGYRWTEQQVKDLFRFWETLDIHQHAEAILQVGAVGIQVKPVIFVEREQVNIFLAKINEEKRIEKTNLAECLRENSRKMIKSMR